MEHATVSENDEWLGDYHHLLFFGRCGKGAFNFEPLFSRREREKIALSPFSSVSFLFVFFLFSILLLCYSRIERRRSCVRSGPTGGIPSRPYFHSSRRNIGVNVPASCVFQSWTSPSQGKSSSIGLTIHCRTNNCNYIINALVRLFCFFLVSPLIQLTENYRDDGVALIEQLSES